MAAQEAILKRCAAVIRSADALLICTGAGMGVDSGLGTFRGRNAGVWPPLKAFDLDFSEMSSPSWFANDERLGWSFWHFRHQAYVNGTPHKGYDILAKWGTQMKHGLFSATSNIDGHWARTEGVGEERVYECHGSVTYMQCVKDTGRIWRTDPAEIAKMTVPAWDLEPGEQVEVIAGAVRAAPSSSDAWIPAIVGADGCGIESKEGKKLAVRAVRRPGQTTDLTRVDEGSTLPKCAETGGRARPNVLMFGDFGVNCARIDAMEQRFQTWTASLPPDARLVVVEVGAGLAVPTIRYLSESTTTQFRNGTLLRLNLDDSEVPESLGERAISVGGLGALEALSKIDALLP